MQTKLTTRTTLLSLLLIALGSIAHADTVKLEDLSVMAVGPLDGRA